MIDYDGLSDNHGSIVAYRPIANPFPWCFRSSFIPSVRQNTYGIAPIIGVLSKTGHTFVSAIVIDDASVPHIVLQDKQIQQPHLQHAVQTAREWLLDNLPIWLRFSSSHTSDIYQLNGPQRIPTVDGASVGLSATLAHISALLKLPLPSNWMYSATINARGEVGGVSSIEKKVQGIRQLCPTVDTLVIGNFETQGNQVTNLIENAGLKAHVVHTIEEAMAIIPIGPFASILDAFEASLEQWVQQSDEELHSFIQHIFLSALQGFSQLYGWGSLRNLLHKIQTHPILWSRLPLHLQCKVDITALIASRYYFGREYTHRSDTWDGVLFGEKHYQWLTTCPRSEQLQTLPHLIQQITEWPSSISCPEKILTMAQATLPTPTVEWIPPLHLKLSGSWGRYLVTHTDRYEEAFQWQRLCFEQWCAHGLYDQASYPLCALMDLSLHLPQYDPVIEQLWIQFKRLPNSRVSQIRRFIPNHWKKRLF